MVASRIEAVVRSFGTALTRSRLIGGAPLGIVSRLGDATAARSAPTTCPPLGHRCGTDGACCFNTRCRDGVCRCEPGWDDCGTGRCRYLRFDHHHCGACGVVCGPTRQCLNGVCI